MPLVQVTKSTDTNDAGATTVVTAAFGSNTTSGNAIVGHVSWQGTGTGDLTGISGQGTGTIVDAVLVDSANAIYMATYVVPNIAGGATTPVAATFSSSVAFRRITAQEFSGVATAGQPNAHKINASNAFGTGTDAVTSTTAATSENCTVWGVAYDDTSATIPSVGTGFTSSDSTAFGAGDGFRTEYKTGVASGTPAATFTTTAGTDNIGVAMIALVEAGGGGGGSAFPRPHNALGATYRPRPFAPGNGR